MRAGRALAMALCISGMAALGTACSVDLAKLRGAAAAARDGGVDAGWAALVADAGTVESLPTSVDSSVTADSAAPDLGGDEAPSVGRDSPDAWAAIQDVFPAGESRNDGASEADASMSGDDVGSPEDTRPGDAPADEDNGSGRADSAPSGAGGAGGAMGMGGAGGLSGAGGFTGSGGAVVDPDLVLWYRFDESSGTVAADASASGLDGKLGSAGAGGNATFSSDCQVGTHALRLTPASSGSTFSGGYLTAPAPASLAPNAITIALWVKLASSSSDQTWARLFDFGTGTGASDPYLYMTPRASDTSNPRFGITNVGRGVGGVQRLDSPSPLSANVWHHIAVVLPAGATYTGSLYIDGVVVATNDAMTVHPADVGMTTDNWLGRSPNSGDPYLSAWLDDFRIYRRALTAAEITALLQVR